MSHHYLQAYMFSYARCSLVTPTMWIGSETVVECVVCWLSCRTHTEVVQCKACKTCSALVFGRWVVGDYSLCMRERGRTVYEEVFPILGYCYGCMERV